MKRIHWRSIWIFLLGMLTLAVGYFLVTVFGGLRKPTREGIVEDWDTICFWYSDQGTMFANISPLGCYSSTCTLPISQTGTALLDQDQYQIHLDSRFVLTETSRFPLPCIDNCAGGGSVYLDLGELQVGKYAVFFKGEPVGDLNVFSGLPTPQQCFENPGG